jgi:hypothetical protein
LPSSIAWPDPARKSAFAAWLAAVAPPRGLMVSSLRPASSDASFRRYLRADLEDGGSVVVMDAPPPQEDVRPFVHVAGLIAQAGLHAPRVLEADPGHGFLLLDDLGNELYLAALQSAQAAGDMGRADALMRDAIAALVVWQEKVPARRCRPTTTRCCAASWRSFPSGAWCANAASPGAARRPRPGLTPATAWWRAPSPSRRSRCTATGCRAT